MTSPDSRAIPRTDMRRFDFPKQSPEEFVRGWCGDDLALDEIVGHLAAEGRSIPAPWVIPLGELAE